MKRAKAKQHTRKTKSGKTIVVNKGVTGKPKTNSSAKSGDAFVERMKDYVATAGKNPKIQATLESDFSEKDYPGRTVTHKKDHAIVNVPKGGTWKVHSNGNMSKLSDAKTPRKK